jgi:2-furoate---CoA ligase
MLKWTGERFPERIAFAGSRTMTYRDWDERTNRIANALLSLGVKPGDRVALFLSNSEVMASTHLALQKLGVMSTPLNIRLSVPELAYCLNDAEPAIAICDDASLTVTRGSLAQVLNKPKLVSVGSERLEESFDFEELVASADIASPAIGVSDSDPSVMLYTAGTTGKPKGVPRTQHNEFSAALAHVVQCHYESGEVTLGAMPMYHTMGLRSLLSMLVVGGKFVELPAFDAARAIGLIESEGVSALYLVATAFFALVQTGELHRAARTVRKLAFAGAPMTSALTASLEETLNPEVFVNHYGSTEVYTFAIEDDASHKPGCAGRAGMFSRLRVVSTEPEEASLEPLVAGVVGEIVASLESDEAFAGYWNRPDVNERSLRDGWYRTGDLGHLDENGDLWVDGRVDDMIISGGENVHPVEVEDVFSRHPQISEVVVAGLSDDKWGQVVTAFIVPTSEVTDYEAFAAQILRWGREEANLSSYKCPKRVVVVQGIPKSPVGKILRRKLVAGDYLECKSSESTQEYQ